MLPTPLIIRAFIVPLLMLLVNSVTTEAQTPADKFYHAYYLEHAQGDFAAAAPLYADVTESRKVKAARRAEAQVRLACCREELACSDFARLMPPEPLAYVELNQPGEHLSKLIDQLGLLERDDQPPAPGETRVSVSPGLIDAALGIRGLAVAVTSIDMEKERPTGVAVLHPGDMDLVRGFIRTALPAHCEAVEPVGGYATYFAEEVYVTLTNRLVIAGTSRAEVEGVIARLKNEDEASLATSGKLADVIQERDDNLLFFCVNPKPLLPLINDLMAANAPEQRELALVQALLDLPSIRAVTGQLNIAEDGLTLGMALCLDEGHQNLVYNFFRRPAIDPQSLRCIPAGAAGFLAIALNEAPSAYEDEDATERVAPPVVTALDIGREIFANINGIALYALPPSGAAAHPQMVPDMAAVITVNDPAKSQALWTQILGIASLAAGGYTMDGTATEIEGVETRVYRFDPNVKVHFAAHEHELIIASTETAVARSIEARRDGRCILDDPALAPSLEKIGPHTTVALVAHPSRCLQIAKPFMSPHDLAEAQPVIGLLSDTAVAIQIDHSDQMLRIAAGVSGVPDISGLVNEMLARERPQHHAVHQVVGATRQQERIQKAAALDELLAVTSTDTRKIGSVFDLLAVRKGDEEAARAFADKLFDRFHKDANALNNFAWALLTEDKYEEKYDDVALRYATRANELTDHGNWAYVDTLALAMFKAGRIAEAIKLEQHAIQLSESSGGGGLQELKAALARFEKAAEQE